MTGQRPLLLPLRRFALDDGPGIRSTVFFKGCPLSCVWCHNPESMSGKCEIAFYPRRCIKCGECSGVCPESAISMGDSGRINRDICAACGGCCEACPALALERMGEYVPPDKLVELLLRDQHFYEASGGGVTLSGGEPTFYADYLEKVLTKLKRQHIHIAIQTCGLFDFELFSTRFLTKIDLIFYDIKLFAPDLHLRYTGVDNRVILNNFARLARVAREKMIPRVPLVPGITATRENLSDIASYLHELGYERGELLPYNPGGIDKRRALGRETLAGLPASLMASGEVKRNSTLFFSILAGAAAQPEAP